MTGHFERAAHSLGRAAATDATNRCIGLDEHLYAYLCETTLREPALVARLRAETSRLPRGTMQINSTTPEKLTRTSQGVLS